VAIDAQALAGRWIHSHEEDSEGELVYRRPDYAFPPVRGRDALELGRGGELVEGGPGPTDVPAEHAGRWDLRDDTLVLRSGAGERALTVVSVEGDRLVLRA
jgi:hypothetical protein